MTAVLNLMNLLLTLGGVGDSADPDIDLRSEPDELTADVRRCRGWCWDIDLRFEPDELRSKPNEPITDVRGCM